MKKKNFGFKTPVRRNTKNITGNKVGGELTGGECKIMNSNMLQICGKKSYKFCINTSNAKPLFKNNIGIIAIGGYFLSNNSLEIELCIEYKNNKIIDTYKFEKNSFLSIGLDYAIELNEMIDKTVNVYITFNAHNVCIDYLGFSYGFLNKLEFQKQSELYIPYNNNKRKICFPEQFYFEKEIILEESIKGALFIIKSCNRCQRFLPINHKNQRESLAYSNHCTSKAPCTHSNFSKYVILENFLSEKDLKNFISNECDRNYTLILENNNSNDSLSNNFVKAYYGHQLECKACKKFFVNHPLNPLRTATQHREDGLRRRAIERLIGELLKKEWIYHSFRISQKNENEFDKHIWEKFCKKCFKCGEAISSISDMHLDHTMPLSFLYPLDETATCLCSKCNSEKSDIFPIDFYNSVQLKELSTITGISLEMLESKKANQQVVDKLYIKENLIWFIEVFLNHPDYIKIRDGKRACDSILHSVQKAINNSNTSFDIKKEYNKLLVK